MINTLTLIQQGNNHYIDSREVAQLIGKQHKHLLADIRRYSQIISKTGQPKIRPSDFFVESSYINSQNKEMPCYLLSKMGCECISHKLTGEKGVLFTVLYVAIYNEMETKLRKEQEIKAIANPSLEDCNETSRTVIHQLKRIGVESAKMIDLLNNLYEPLGLTVATVAENDGFGNIPRTYTAQQLACMFGMYSLYGNPHATAISCLLNENIRISNEHKYAISDNCENGITGTFRYSEYAIELIHDWLNDCGYPNKINGFYCTYHVIYRKYNN